MATFDVPVTMKTTDPGSGVSGAAPSAGLAPTPMYFVRVPFAAGSGTTSEVAIVCQQKLRLALAFASVTTSVTSSVVQCFTATGGGGTAATSSISTGTTGTIYDNLTTAKQVFASGASIFVRQSGGATLAGCDVYLGLMPEA